MAERQSWGKDFEELRSRLDRAADASRRVTGWVRSQLGPADLPPDVVTLVEEISSAQLLVNQLSDRLHSGPLGLLIGGHAMSREAYYVLVALGVLPGGTFTGDPYGDFQMLHHEDEKGRCYISLDEAPAGTIRIHAGLRPEEISWERLRPEQRDFFGRHLPEVAARFKRKGESPAFSQTFR